MNLVNEGALAHWGAVAPKENKFSDNIMTAVQPIVILVQKGAHVAVYCKRSGLGLLLPMQKIWVD
jgi:hypothetical protein